MTRAALIALVLAFAPSVSAAPRPCSTVEAPCYLERGERAPYGGELLPPAFVLALLEDHAALDVSRAQAAQAVVDLEAERELRAVDRTEADAIRTADLTALRRVEALARALVEPPSWYERPSFVVPATATVTLGVALSLFFAWR